MGCGCRQTFSSSAGRIGKNSSQLNMSTPSNSRQTEDARVVQSAPVPKLIVLPAATG